MSKQVKILLVDDREDDVIIVQEILSDQDDYKIVGAVQSGEEALTYLRRQGDHRDAVTPDLVLLDINMSEKNGFEVMSEMTADTSLQGIPVIFLTTSDREEDKLQALLTGGSFYLIKPLDVDKLDACWRKIARRMEREEPKGLL